MPGNVKLHPSGHEFEVDADDSILEAALRSGLSVNYGCSNGNCGLCKARLVKGELFKTRRHDFAIPEAEKLQGYFLACSNTNRGDIEVEATEATEAAEIPEQQVSARVKKVKPLNQNIVLLQIQTPRTKRLRFLAGQGAGLNVADRKLGEFPIASCPCDDRNLEFHIRINTNNDLAGEVKRLTAHQTIEIWGPTGNFILDETSKRPVVFLAYGTGFAPIKSLIEHAMQLEHAEHIYLYWLADNSDTHYMHNLARSWTDAFDNFTYQPVQVDGSTTDISRALDQTLQQQPATAEHDYYIAGPSAFCDASRAVLRTPRVPDQQVHTHPMR